jgi:asparagine synthase (glutamine-hydrolysing)
MCGIFAILGSQATKTKTHERAAEAASKLSHRGPDWSGVESFDCIKNSIKEKILSFAIAHERLQIMDPQGGEQPIVDKEGLRILSVNGEIYNYKELMADFRLAPYLASVQSKSDCEVIIPLWKHYTHQVSSSPSSAGSPGCLSALVQAAINVNRDLDGDFAYVLWDQDRLTYVIARDPIGVNPLYIGYSDEDGSIIVSSEIKAFSLEYVTDFREFPPGCVLVADSFLGDETFDAWLHSHIRSYYTPLWKSKGIDFLPDNKMQIQSKIRELLTEAVKKRLMSDVPIGFLLSGGLDSSLICSIAARLMHPQQLNTFSIGLKGSPDLAAAREVANYLGTKHHEFEFTVEQGIAALPNVIYSLETFDVTTIRAGTPMYLLARRIKALGIKTVLSGESSDEQFGGYLYFHKAPNEQEFYHETVDKVLNLSKYDCLRANKALAAWGVEGRVPFLSKALLDYVMSIDPKHKMILKGSDQNIEKWILRTSFQGYLPPHLLMRPKEQFSDGVGYGWIGSLKQLVESSITDHLIQNASTLYPHKTPKTKEAYFYRKLFEKRLPHPRAYMVVPWSRSVACSTERALTWEKAWLNLDEPSGRAVDVHLDHEVTPSSKNS